MPSVWAKHVSFQVFGGGVVPNIWCWCTNVCLHVHLFVGGRAVHRLTAFAGEQVYFHYT